MMLAASHCLLCAAVAGLQQWDAFDYHKQKATTLLKETEIVEQDTAWALQLAGDLALKAGQPARAQQAYEMALHMWQTLKREPKIAEVRLALAKCSPNSLSH